MNKVKSKPLATKGIILRLGFLVGIISSFINVMPGSPATALPDSYPLLGGLGGIARHPVTISVHPGKRQQFIAFGTSHVPDSYKNIPSKIVQSELSDILFNDLGLKVLRLWYGPNQDYIAAKKRFYQGYVDSGAIDDALARGSDLLLAPACGEGHIDDLPRLTRNIAHLLEDLKKEKGYAFIATGLSNEPNGMTPAEIVSAVKNLRANLDARGLRDVKIIAPEAASVDKFAFSVVDAMKADPDAWNALDGVATHSYNMAATEKFAKKVFGHGKSYWMTEASDNGDEGPDNDQRAATTAARVLNDLNHGVTHWIWFIGFGTGGFTDGDAGTKLVVYDPKTKKILKHLKFHYLRQLRNGFLRGAEIRHCTSSIENEMDYSYGQKPALNVSAAKNSDGSWVLAVVNDTGISKWQHSWLYPEKHYEVTFDVAELVSGGTIRFDVVRSGKGAPLRDDGELTMIGGKITITIAPRELITLRSATTDQR